jgi:peptidoglycan/LPS O-acetylase OafA/YrhL
VSHATISTNAFVGAVPHVLKTYLEMGYLGVDFFFVLSGFIIMFSHMDDASSVDALKRYTLKRIIRIYPAYLPRTAAIAGNDHLKTRPRWDR